MKTVKTLCVCSLVLLWSGSAFAQDPVKVDSSHYKVLFENASVRVLKISYPAGAKSQMHQHPEAIVVPLADSKVQFTMPDGKTEDSSLANEVAVYMPAATHNPANVGTGAVDAVLVEFKTKTPGTATIPATREGMGMKMLAEGPRAVAYRTTATPTFQEPAGTKHDYDQVVIALGPSQMALSIDGKPAKKTWARGDVQFIGRGVPHESKNAGGKPVEFVIVAIK
jgi:quercetin dioxygenase-like cupin family protein